MPTEAELALIARLREHRARVEERGLAAARPETEAQLLNLLRDLELEGTPERVRYRRDEETPRREAPAMAPASTTPRDSRLETDLQAELRASEARMAQAEDELRYFRRRSSMASGMTSDEFNSSARPKLERPWKFEGHYSELVNVLTWLKAVGQYLNQCSVPEHRKVGYARTYLSRLVQTWLDARFPTGDPSWDRFTSAIIARYLPDDHDIRVELKFERIRQRSTLMDYVEQFQRIDSAMVLAKVQLSDRRKVLQFIKGIKAVDDRRFILEKNPKNLDETYRVVLTLRQAKTLAVDPTGRGIREYESHPSRWDNSRDETRKRDERRLKVLTGRDRQRAWDEGRCLRCGSSRHKIRDCPDNLDEPEEQEYSESRRAHKGNSETEQTDTESEASTSTESEEDENEER